MSVPTDLAIETRGLVKKFGSTLAVDGVDLSVARGGIYGVLGPNGAGKTTAFNVITGVYQPTNGQVLFHDKAYVCNHPRGKMAKLYKGENPAMYTSHHTLAPTPDHITKMGIARTFQNIRLWKSMTVFDNVIIAKHMRAKHNIFSSTFRTSHKEEARMRAETESLPNCSAT